MSLSSLSFLLLVFSRFSIGMWKVRMVERKSFRHLYVYIPVRNDHSVAVQLVGVLFGRLVVCFNVVMKELDFHRLLFCFRV